VLARHSGRVFTRLGLGAAEVWGWWFVAVDRSPVVKQSTDVSRREGARTRSADSGEKLVLVETGRVAGRLGKMAIRLG
jgi:hypothetical protein